jgi:hypothetical protein
MNDTLTDLAAIVMAFVVLLAVYLGIARYQPPPIVLDINPMKRIASESTGGLPDPMLRSKPEVKISAAAAPFDPMRAMIKTATPATPSQLGQLPPGDAQPFVASICNACHSPQIITQQRLSAAKWDFTLTKMTKVNGMADLPPELRQRIVSYLAQHFAP